MLTRHLKALVALLFLSLLVLGLSMCGSDKKTTAPPASEGVAKLTVSASPDKVAADGTTTDVTVQAVQDDGTNGNGLVELKATNGSLSSGGVTTTVTLSNGRASVKWNCDAAKTPACVGNQTVTATWGAKTATVSVEFTSGSSVTDGGTDATAADSAVGDAGNNDGGVQTLTYQGTKCGSLACAIMGVKGSGFNESATISFKVLDAANKGVPGITVNFALASAPAGTTTSPSAVTDAQGIASAIVASGPTIGSFNVVASFNTASGVVSTPSATIGIRGAIPTNKAFTFSCARVNIDAYNAPSPPRIVTVTCNLKLLDRYNNPVGTGTSVNFKSEAGGIESSKMTQAYNPAAGANNTAEGTGTVTFSTDGDFPAVNTTPLVALPSQYPNARDPEPSWLDGALTRNPRDGLVTLIAYVQGEEYFSDDNSNGTWDSGEQFIDQGEPFVDSNDNGVWDTGETRIDLNNNGVWDGPNGVWNNNTTIWAETHVLYTDKPSATNSFIQPPTFTKIALGGSQSFSAYFLDLNMNYVSKDGPTVIALEQAGSRTLTTQTTQGILDDYGFGIQRVLVASPGETECLSSTPICKHKTLFTTWPGTGSGSSVNVTFTNPSAGSPTGGVAACRVKATEGGTTLVLESLGTTAPP